MQSFIEKYKNRKLEAFAFAVTLFLAIALQIQISLFKEGDYLGLRVNLGDFILPLAGLVVLASLGLRKTQWPVWQIKHGYLWLVALTAIMSFALIHGYMVNGEWSRWAVLNKYAGWLILMSYFGLGGWLVRNFDSDIRTVFMRIFLYFYIACLFFFMPVMFLTHMGILPLGEFTRYPLDGFMANRNAYAFLTSAMLGMTSLSLLTDKPLIPRFVIITIWFLTPLSLYYIGSRAGLIMVFLILVVLLLLNFKTAIKNFIPALLIGVMLLVGAYSFGAKNYVRENHFARFEDMIVLSLKIKHHEDLDYEKLRDEQIGISEALRVHVFNDAISLWKEKPITGIGLGSFLKDQYQRYDPQKRHIDIIDSSALWLLTETGLVGLLIFLGFYGTSLHRLWRNSRKLETNTDLFRYGVVLMLICFGIMSLVHELLYSRFFWLFLGMALAYSKKEIKTQKAF